MTVPHPVSAASIAVDASARDRAETLLAGEQRLLEMIAAGTPLGETLDAVCRLIEQVSPEWLASILLVDATADSVWHGAAPMLPGGYVSAIDGARIGPVYGPCGLAALGHQVVASDIAADPRWSAAYRELALQHGLRACWSTPIKTSSGKVLGVFEIYLRQPGDPSGQAGRRLDPFIHLAAIAIERAQAMPAEVSREMLDALRRSEERYARAMEASGEGHTDWIVATDEFYASPRLLEMCGLPPDAKFAGRSDFVARFPIHPEDRDRIVAAVNAHHAGTSARLELDMRVLRRGETRWMHAIFLCSRDASGALLRVSFTVTDVTDRKIAEDELRLRKGELQGLMESVSDYLWSAEVAADGSFSYRYYSPVAERILGRSPEYLLESPERWLGLVHPLDRPRLAEIFRRLTSGATERVDVEYRIVRPDGALRWVRDSTHATRVEDGRILLYGVVGDITERKLAEQALRESEARFRSLTELSSDWYWEQDESLRFTYLSSQADHWSGYPGQLSLGRTRWELDGITPLSTSWAEHQAVLAARQPFRDLEYSRVAADGTIRYVSVSGAPVFDEQGRFKGYQGTGRDITERKRIEEALRSRQEMLEVALREIKASEAELRSIIDAIPMQVWCALPDGSTEFQNRRYLDFAGQGADEARGFGWRDAIHPEDVEAYMARWQEIQASQAVGEAEARFRRFDGEYRSILMRVAPVHDERGRVVKWYGANTDIEDRKRAEALLAGEKALLEMIAKGTPLGQTLETLCRFVEENAAGCLCGIMLVDPSGMRLAHGAAPSLPASYNDGIHGRRVGPHSGPCAMAAFLKEQVISTDIAAETRWREDDWCAHALAHGLRACWSTPIVSSAERALGTLALYFREPRIPASQDLGLMERLTHLASIAIERTQVEQALRRSETALRQAQRLEAMGTLAGGIAHDFNNILGAILGYGEMALREASKGSRLRRDLDGIMTAGERGRSLVERILAFSRSGIGERRAVHVEQVVREALDQLAAKLPADITLAPRLHAGRAAVLGDPTQIHQVLMNLATNAIQAMSSGGTLRVRLDPARVDAAHVATTGTLGAGDYVVLEVADSGTGISPEILERIFEPFFTTKEVGVGTGLGLSLVHGIVTELGGAIDVSSTVGRGSTFTVYLPRAGDAAHDQEQEQPEPPRGNRQQVLIVDDEAPLVTLATETLAELGYVPSGFTSSAAALAAFCADPARFDAVITDERMPGMSGSGLIREIRKVRRTIPILLVSGYAGGAVVRRAIESGADEVLKKPLSARDLAASLARVLDARSLEAR